MTRRDGRYSKLWQDSLIGKHVEIDWDLIDYSNCGNAGLLMSPFATLLRGTLRGAAADFEELFRQARGRKCGGGRCRLICCRRLVVLLFVKYVGSMG